MATRRVLAAAILALLAGLVLAPSAGAATPVKATVRAEGGAATVMPATSLAVPASARITGTDGTTFQATFASAFSALGLAADLRGVPMTFSVGSLGVFVNSIAGLGGPPAWTSFWLYAVNGWAPDVGSGALHLRSGDRVVFYEEAGAGTAAADQLVVRCSRIAPTPGQSVSFNVLGDDLAKPDSLTDAARFHLDPSTVQTPAQSPVVDGATLHIGTRTYVLSSTVYPGSTLTLSDLPVGTYAVWAEKAPDATTTFVRSAPRLINVGRRPVISKVVVRPNPFTPSVARVHVAFTLSKPAAVRLTVRDRRGSIVAKVQRSLPAGRVALVWNGRTSAGRWAAAGVYTLRLVATDSWGRVSNAVTAAVTAR
jgi:hypothetical protein